MLTYLKTAAEKFPESDDVLVCLFFMHVRACDFNAQQAVARKLLQKKPTDKSLRFWMAISTMMQGENDVTLAKRMYLPLAERMLEKAFSDGVFESHTDLQLYLTILNQLEKYSKALEVLKNTEFIGTFNLHSSSASLFYVLAMRAVDLCSVHLCPQTRIKANIFFFH